MATGTHQQAAFFLTRVLFHIWPARPLICSAQAHLLKQLGHLPRSCLPKGCCRQGPGEHGPKRRSVSYTAMQHDSKKHLWRRRDPSGNTKPPLHQNTRAPCTHALLNPSFHKALRTHNVTRYSCLNKPGSPAEAFRCIALATGLPAEPPSPPGTSQSTCIASCSARPACTST